MLAVAGGEREGGGDIISNVEVMLQSGLSQSHFCVKITELRPCEDISVSVAQPAYLSVSPVDG